jgi:thiamine-phosphate pyrophosphorylase
MNRLLCITYFPFMQTPDDRAETYRVLDVNLNRLREALRVIEEYPRFVDLKASLAVDIKRLRHDVSVLSLAIGEENLLAHRDIATDPFASVNRPEEMTRATPMDVARAAFKRAQEASRVIEEYSKLTPHADASETAKAVRFSLYALEKEFMKQTV